MPKRFSVQAANVVNLQRALREYPDFMVDAMKSDLKEELSVYKAEMVKRSSNPPGPIAEGAGVHKQTGRLARSYGVVLEGTKLSDLKAVVASFADRKAPLLELGGTVTAKTEKWIFIPTDPNRFPSGLAVQKPGQVLDAGGYFVNLKSRKWRETFFRRAIIDGKASPAWNLLVANTDTPFFIMSKSAQYRPLLGMVKASEKYANLLPAVISDRAVKYWQQVVV